jgi:hypothetical protein
MNKLPPKKRCEPMNHNLDELIRTDRSSGTPRRVEESRGAEDILL